MDVLGVEAGGLRLREQQPEEVGAGLGDLVEVKRGTGGLGEDRELAGARRGLQHAVGRLDGGRQERGEADLERGRELLQRLAFLGAPRVGGSERSELGHHVEQLAGRGRAPTHRRQIAAQEQHLRGFASFVGILPPPGPGTVGSAEGTLHRLAEDAGISLPPARKKVRDLHGRRAQALGFRLVIVRRNGWKGRKVERALGRVQCHGRGFREVGRSPARGARASPSGHPSLPSSASGAGALVRGPPGQRRGCLGEIRFKGGDAGLQGVTRPFV